MYHALYSLPIIILLFASLPDRGSAQGLLQGISGSLDLNYSLFSSKTTDASGVTTKTETNAYNPRFTLSINTNIFPNIRLNAGGVFEKNVSIFKSDGEDTTSTITKVRPYFFLTFKDPLYAAGIGYSRNEETDKTEGHPGVTLINENYIGNLGWKPEGFPSIDSQFLRTNTFDEKHLFQDTTKDLVSITSKYDYKGLGLRYQATYIDTKNKLNNLEIEDLTQNGWVTYSNSFFNRRVSLNTSYNIVHNEVKTTSTQSTGEVNFQISPFAGLSEMSDTPAMVTLAPNSALIDGNLTASSGINIGLPPLGGDFRRRNIGLDLLNPTEVNNLLIWVDRELPADIANSFSWDVYASSDNLNWTFLVTVFSAPFGPFQNHFEIKFANVTTRYIKVVTQPLSAAVPGAAGFPNIFITEIQGFLQKTVAEVSGIKTTRTSHIYNLDVKTRILDIPTLFYDLNYFYTKADPEGQLRYTVSNGFSVNHRFSRILSGSARVAREDGSEEKERRSANVYNASLEATPLKTLTNRFVFSGRDEKIGGKPNNNKSFFLYNIAELYKGLEVNLNGGLDFSERETGEKANSTTVNFLASIIPYQTLTLTLDYSYTKTDQTGGGMPDSSATTQRGDLTVSYNPLRTLFLVARIEVISEADKDTITTQNYGLNWSPFPDGNLQFRFFYNENLTSGEGGKERIIGPGLRWNITRRSFLDLSYQKIESQSGSQKTDSNLFSANLKIFF